MATQPTSRIGLRQLLGLEPVTEPPVHYVKRKSTRNPTGLLPKMEYESMPFGTVLYGKDAVVLTPKKKQPSGSGEGGEKSEEKKEGTTAEEKKGENGNGKNKDNGKKNGDDKSKEGGKTEEQKTDKATDDKVTAKGSDEFTKEEDQELMRLKDENATWAAISTSIGKPIQAVKQRFSQIKPKDWRPPQKGKKAGGDAAKQEEKTAGEAAKPEEKKEEPKTGDPKTDVKQDGSGKEKANGKERGNGGGVTKENEKKQEKPVGDDMTSVYEFEGQTYKKRGADEHFPAEMLHFAGEFDDRWYWLNMASRIFDKFGTRYTPEELKVKMTGHN